MVSDRFVTEKREAAAHIATSIVADDRVEITGWQFSFVRSFDLLDCREFDVIVLVGSSRLCYIFQQCHLDNFESVTDHRSGWESRGGRGRRAIAGGTGESVRPVPSPGQTTAGQMAPVMAIVAQY